MSYFLKNLVTIALKSTITASEMEQRRSKKCHEMGMLILTY